MLKTWIEAHPDDLSAMALLSTILTAAKQPAAAASVLETLLARQPDDTRVMNNLALAYQELGDARAWPLALRAYLSTFSPVVADTLGGILLASGGTQDALMLLRFARREMPDELSVQLHLAQAAHQAGLRDEARVLLTSLSKQQFDGRATAMQLLSKIE
jgi:predicted Zn-dependent protease